MEWIKTIIEADQKLFLYLNGFNNSFMDNFMFMISQMGIWFLLYAAIIYSIFKTYGKKGFLILVFIIILILLSSQFSVLFKETVKRLRPYQDPGIKNLTHSIYNSVNSLSLYGFVSSHATNTFAVFTFTSLIFRNRWYAFTLLIGAILVCYSRIYLGVHFPLDVLGGIILGCFTGWLVYKSMIMVEKHFFIKRFPIIKETRLSDYHALIITAVLLFTNILIIIHSLYKANIF
jgi:undecaprenyl-diphosphatase